MRTIISDYVERPRLRQALKLTLTIVTVVIIALGTLVIFTFDPCLTGAEAETIKQFCTSR